ncbi:MAG: hypothetical protein E7406_04865 [Ruminococcaceae bacterium]|nr:hypothetical protein [Oscillospiraceae bacterium]
MKKVLCLMCAVFLLICGCANKETASNPNYSASQEIEELICKFSENLIEADFQALAECFREGNEYHKMLSERATPEESGTRMKTFREKYEEYGGDANDFKAFQEYAKNFDIKIDRDRAVVEVEILSLGAGATDRSDSHFSKPTFVREEKNAQKIEEDGQFSLEVSEEEYYMSEDGEEFVKEGNYTTLSYGTSTFTCEKVDGKWYIADFTYDD